MITNMGFPSNEDKEMKFGPELTDWEKKYLLRRPQSRSDTWETVLIAGLIVVLVAALVFIWSV